MKNFLLTSVICCALFLFGTEIKAQELVLNGNLESWDNTTTPTSWTLIENITQESGTVHGGTYSAKHTSESTTKKFQQVLTGVVPGSLYTLSYWYYDNDPAAKTRIWCYWLSGSTTLPDYEAELRPPSTYSSDNPQWIQVTYAMTAPAAADGFRFEVRVYNQDGNVGGGVFYDDFSLSTGGSPLPEPSYYPTDFVATANNLSIDLVWTDSEGGQLPQAYLIKASEANDIVAPVDGVAEADDLDWTDGKAAKNVMFGAQAFTFSNLKADQQYFFKIYPYTNGGADINFKTDGTAPSASATTPDISVILFKDFETQTFDPWDTISLANNASNKRWSVASYGGNYYAYLNGYQATEFCNDWLISPSMNFNDYINETLSFRTAKNYTGPDLQIKISNNYVTGADPTTGTWTPITATLSPGGYTWTPSGNIDLSAVTGSNVHLAFHYTSEVDAAAWEVDDIMITGEVSSGVDTKVRDMSVTLSPNPATDWVNLTFAAAGKKEITIVTVTGTQVYSSSTDQPNVKIRLDNLSKGVYFIRVTETGSGRPVVQKLVIR
ncbi:MAG: choice-of-anchor J domain-containing protein [bacterium]